MQINTKKPIRVMELFNLGKEYQGKEFKVVTDNEHYGKTITVKNGQLINKRDGLTMAATSDLLFNTKVRIKDSKIKVSINDFLAAFKEGKKVGIAFKNEFRELDKSSNKHLKELREELSNVHVLGNISVVSSVLSYDEIITMDELLYGEFYILN